jgi:hypothetical protein
VSARISPTGGLIKHRGLVFTLQFGKKDNTLINEYGILDDSHDSECCVYGLLRCRDV